MATELVANRQAMPKRAEAQLKYQLELAPSGDIELDHMHKKHVCP